MWANFGTCILKRYPFELFWLKENDRLVYDRVFLTLAWHWVFSIISATALANLWPLSNVNANGNNFLVSCGHTSEPCSNSPSEMRYQLLTQVRNRAWTVTECIRTTHPRRGREGGIYTERTR